LVVRKKYLRYEYEKFKLFYNKHDGERCFIVGNGPSLRHEDLSQLETEYSFAANGIYRIFDKTVYRPTYYCILDQEWWNANIDYFTGTEVKSQLILEYSNRCPIIKVYNTDGIKNNPIRTFRNRMYPRRFTDYIIREKQELLVSHFKKVDCIPLTTDPIKCLWDPMTVTAYEIRIALFMGFKEIYLIGVDNSFSKAKMHFYGTKGFENAKSQQQLDLDIEGFNLSYERVKKHAELYGAKIYNATRGGELDIFPRVNFDNIVKKDRVCS
jgi:hypothetical protein